MTDTHSRGEGPAIPEANKVVSFLPEVFADPPAEPEVLVSGLVRRAELMVMGVPVEEYRSEVHRRSNDVFRHAEGCLD